MTEFQSRIHIGLKICKLWAQSLRVPFSATAI